MAVASIKGAPGVTTAALALALGWPAHRRAMLVEADSGGGDIAARFGLGGDSGAVGLATSLRHERASPAGVVLGEHCALLPGGIPVLTAPSSPMEAIAALGIVIDVLPSLAADADCDVVLDCGRVGYAAAPDAAGRTRSTALVGERLLASADIVLVVTAAELADLSRVRALLPQLRTINPTVSLVLRQPQVWPEAEIERELDVTVAGMLPTDTVAADALAGRRQVRQPARLALFRAAAGMAARLAGPVHESADDAVAAGQDVVVPALLTEGATAP